MAFHNGVEFMIWGMIYSEGAVELVEVTGKMKSEDYISILKSNVVGKRLGKEYLNMVQFSNKTMHLVTNPNKY